MEESWWQAQCHGQHDGRGSLTGAVLNGQPVRAVQRVLAASVDHRPGPRVSGIALVVSGAHDKTGADDVGLGALVRARLHALGGAALAGSRSPSRRM